MAAGDEFSGILNQYANKADQQYNADTAGEANAQNQSNQEFTNANAEGAKADQQAQALSNLGDQYSNMSNVTDMYNTDQQQQLKNMGFNADTLNNANQNIAQTVGQEGAANNQIAAQGGTRGFNAVGTENRLQGVQNQANNAIAANTQVQSNELGQANAASTFTGQEIGAQQRSQSNAVQAYNDSAAQYNNTMANYANIMATAAQQATTYGGLVGSNLANIMQAGYSASQIAMQKYNAELEVAQTAQAYASANLSNAQAGLASSQTVGQNLQNEYNKQIMPLQKEEKQMVIDNSKAAAKQISSLQDDINGIKSAESSENPWEASWGPIGYNLGVFKGNTEIANDESQINSLRSQLVGAGAS